MVLSNQDSGRTVTVETGSSITLRLEENPTTGYRWSVEASAGLDLLEDRNESGGAPGAGGMRVLTFRVARAGSFALRLKHWRDWEGEDSVINRFDAEIIAQ